MGACINMRIEPTQPPTQLKLELGLSLAKRLKPISKVFYILKVGTDQTYQYKFWKLNNIPIMIFNSKKYTDTDFWVCRDSGVEQSYKRVGHTVSYRSC